MELVQGRATVEVTDIHGENNLRIIEDGRSTELRKNGLYDFDALKAKKFNKQTYEAAELYRWTSLRSSYLAEANADVARTYVVGGMGWYGDGWYWDPWFSAYTFIPGDGILYSPFGWGFYSPGFVYAAPFFYGGRYYHHFGYDSHAWGPGGHYGSPRGYSRGTHDAAGPHGGYGSHGGATAPGFAGGGFHGGAAGHGGGRH